MNEMIQSIPKIKIQYEKTMLLYQAAMEEVLTRINILNREFKIENSYSPIEHISSRIKTPKSIYKKLQKHNLAMTMENMMRHVHDIAGIRIVCKFTSDIYSLVNLLENQHDYQIIARHSIFSCSVQTIKHHIEKCLKGEGVVGLQEKKISKKTKKDKKINLTKTSTILKTELK